MADASTDGSPALAAEVESALRGATRLAVPVDAEDGAPELRDAAVRLATEFGLEVILYDRSEETWMDHPHPKGPIDRDDLDAKEHPELVEQLDELLARQVPARAWIATVPSLAEIVDVVREVGVDVVLVPEHPDGSKLVDKLASGGPAEIVERITALNLEQPVAVLVRHDDGTIAVADSELS